MSSSSPLGRCPLLSLPGRSRGAVPERSAGGPCPSGESPGGFPGQGHRETNVQLRPALPSLLPPIANASVSTGQRFPDLAS